MLRPLELTDAVSVVTAMEWLFAPPSSTPPSWDPDAATTRVRELYESTTGTGFVVVDGDDLLGFVTVYLDLVGIRLGQRAWVNELAVHPDHRSKGYGKQLFDAAQTWARDHGATHLALDSHRGRVDAHRFYRREQPSWEVLSFGWLLDG